jgi:agmatinase
MNQTHVIFGGIGPEYYGYETSRIVVVPVPYDGTSTWIKGADRGPAAIIEASANMELYDIDTGSEVYRAGIHTARPVADMHSPARMVDQVYHAVRQHLENDKFVVTLGGEHSVTIGAVKAFRDKFPDLCVLQVDAHTDLRQEYEGTPFNHACVMARVREWCPFVQVGIRSMDAEERQYTVPGKIFYAKDIIGQGTGWMDHVISQLGRQVYLTIDLDGLDPSVMASTGTPEPGGLSYYDVIRLARKVIDERQLIGFDVVELCPNDHNKAPDFLAAKLVYQLLSLKFHRESKG